MGVVVVSLGGCVFRMVFLNSLVALVSVVVVLGSRNHGVRGEVGALGRLEYLTPGGSVLRFDYV